MPPNLELPLFIKERGLEPLFQSAARLVFQQLLVLLECKKETHLALRYINKFHLIC